MNEKRKFTDMEFIKWNVDVNTTAFKDKLLVGLKPLSTFWFITCVSLESEWKTNY
jgi:hypothetical protein